MVVTSQHCRLCLHKTSLLQRFPHCDPRTWQGLGPFEAHVEGALLAGEDAAVTKHVAQPHAPPDRGAHRGSAPVEADGLLHHVLLLPAIARAHQRHRQLARREPQHVLHRVGRRPPHQPRHVDLPAIPRCARHYAVVAHVVQRGGRQKTRLRATNKTFNASTLHEAGSMQK